jgi:integrase
VPVDRLDPQALAAWRKRLPERSAWGIHKALRQVLNYAVRIKLVDENVAMLVPNPEPKRQEVPTFESVAELEMIGDELATRFAPLPVFAGLTGLRPEEWIALERRDVDRRAGVVHVRRVYTDGQVKRGLWAPALKAPGLARRGPYALRHSYATFAIAAGVPLYELARFMGTSVEQIDRTYGHLLPDSLDRTRASPDGFVDRLGIDWALTEGAEE